MCLVAFQKMFRKIFSDVWLCSWKYHIKHIFFLLLTFSQLPNKYIISFISQNTNKIQKKNHQIRTNNQRDRDRRNRDRSGRRFARSLEASIAIGATAPAGDVGERWCCSLSLSLSLSLSYFPRLEVIWSENRNGKSFLLFWLSNSVNWKCFSVWPNLK